MLDLQSDGPQETYRIARHVPLKLRRQQRQSIALTSKLSPAQLGGDQENDRKYPQH